MFLLFKVLKPFFLPPTLIAFGMALSLIFWKRNARLGRIFLLVTFTVYYLLSIEPVAVVLQRSLIYPFVQPASFLTDTAEAIVLLGGGSYAKGPYQPVPELSGASLKRLWHGVEVYKNLNGKVPILYSGDSGNPFLPGIGEPEIARNMAEAIGVPQEQFFTEGVSRTTGQSGPKVKAFLDSHFGADKMHRVILVTSASHMRRALAVMRAQGIYALPSATDFSYESFHLSLLSFFPSIESFSSSVGSLHEWVGRTVYWVVGETRS